VIAAAIVAAAAFAASPAFRVEGGLPPDAAAEAERGWSAAAALLAGAGGRPPASPRPIRIGVAEGLPPGQAARTVAGAISLRPGPFDERARAALRHEVAHALLLEACPPAGSDRLFHEAFALLASGDLAAWAQPEGGGEGSYLPLAKALEALGRPRSLDGPAARRALGRLLSEEPMAPGRLPAALGRRLSRCEPGARWDPLAAAELAGEGAAADALVVLSRHSGEVLHASGATTLPLPFGSTLKPFLVAAAEGATPLLPPDPSRPGWRCGDGLPARVDGATALLRSCNGWFLDWIARAPEVARLGRWGPALLALGLSGIPADGSEAIGVRPSLRIPARGLAEAYRLLAEARPDLLDVLSRNAREGTLAGIGASRRLAGVAVKTGTVFTAEATPRAGWIAAVDRDVVVVMVRAGRSPRTFAAELAGELERGRLAARGAARVQVFGLLPPGDPVARCTGRGFTAARGGPVPAPDRETPIAELARQGPAVCLGGAWSVRYPGLAAPRDYAGVFTLEPAPPWEAGPGPAPTERERRARRGSDLVFRTTRLAYAAGVVAAEAASLKGEPRVALARIADRNGRGARHAGRPVCDTTHCQAFQGTAGPAREDRAALAEPLPAGGWIPFSRGGTEPWSEERSRGAVQAALGAGARALTFTQGRVRWTAGVSDGEARFEERREAPCERLRGPLKLPSCPERASESGESFRFSGRGEGHGQGLDVEWAERSGLTAAEILRAAGAGKGRAAP
jgi:hypothetical protein